MIEQGETGGMLTRLVRHCLVPVCISFAKCAPRSAKLSMLRTFYAERVSHFESAGLIQYGEKRLPRA